MNKVLSEFFTNAAVALFTVGVIAPVFSKPREASEIWAYLGASIGTTGLIALASYFEVKLK